MTRSGPSFVTAAAVDLGATSGRVVLGRVGPDRLELAETQRFPNGPLRLPSGLHWNLLGLYAGALDGLGQAARDAGDAGLASVGIDSWAVDYGLVAGDRLLGLPHHYRDERRCEEGPERVHRLVERAELYGRNGLQYLAFNTLYQLAMEEDLGRADHLLLVPDLLGFWLTGQAVTERTNASTTGLLDPRTGAWDKALIADLGYPDGAFTRLVEPGARIGEVSPTAADPMLAGLPVVAVGSHDTASAVVGVPLQDERAAYISLGTWGLVGLELPDPIVTDAAREANFTNEGGVDGTTRFLTNVMGTWLLSETLSTWERAGRRLSLGDALAAAEQVPADSVPVIDVQDERFLPPGDMPRRIEDWCREHDVAPPADQPSMVRCIIESLAAAFAASVETAATLAGRTVDVVHVVGGGSRNTLLCQAIADVSGRRVVAGPVEATAIGNLLVQARAAGLIGPDLPALREVIRRTHGLRTHTPT